MHYKLSLISFAIASSLSVMAADLPINGQVRAGNAEISQNAAEMTINQSSPKVSIDWDSFDIASNHSVEFKQPDQSAVAFNNVKGGNASQIQGKLKANGKVFLSNPNGVILGKNAEINVGSLLATTKELAQDQNINDKKLKFVRKTNNEGEINNKAHIVVDSKNGFVVLVGDNVKNEGTIEVKPYEKSDTTTKWVCSGGVPDWYCDYYSNFGYKWESLTQTTKTQTQGQAILATGDSFTVNLEDTYIDVKLDANTMTGLVKNDGIIIADDGRIELTAAGKATALDSVVNNNGVLQANTVSIGKGGTITLSAENIKLDEHSDIQSNNKVSVKSPTAKLNLNAKQGSKITAKETTIEANRVNISGQFERADNGEFFNSEQTTQSNVLNVKTKGKVVIDNQVDNADGDSHIQQTALASMLSSHGQVNLETDIENINGVYRYDLAGFDISGDLTVNSFKNADSLLLLNTPSYVNIHNANIKANGGRLLFGTALWNFYIDNKPDNSNPYVHISDSHFDLNNGSFGVGRNRNYRKVYYHNQISSMEEDQRSYYDFNLANSKFDNVDEFFVGGGFGTVNIDGFTHNGRMNTYINGGNSRTDRNPTYYEYGLRDVKERLTRSEKNHDRRRWSVYSSIDNLDLESLTKLEINEVFGSWFVGTYQPDDPLNTNFIRHHLDTAINIKNSNIQTKNGFIHLMAKNVNIENSNLNVKFDKLLVGAESNINKIGINAEQTVLNNSHLRAEGEDIIGISPNDGFATFYLIGDLLGKNNSSIFVRSHQGYTFKTDGNVTMKGENTPDDLKITVINTGGYAEADKGLDDNNADTYLSSRGFVAGDTPRHKTVLDNAAMTVLAPNGSEAYKTEDNLKFEVKDSATFDFYEKPRIRGFELAKIDGKGGHQLNDQEYLQAFDRAYGIQPSSPSSEQEVSDQAFVPQNNLVVSRENESWRNFAVRPSSLSTGQMLATKDNRLGLRENKFFPNLAVEKNVHLTICDENGDCYDENLGNKLSNDTVTVGTVL